MVHAQLRAASPAESLSERGRLAVGPGLAYVKYLQRRYDLSKVTVIPYLYSIGPFLADPELAQQVFVTAEPIAVRRTGAEVRVFLIADSGFDPYAAVYATRAARVRDAPGVVAAFAEALREGWTAYLGDPRATNAVMGERNPEMDPDTFARAAEAQRPLIERVDGGGAVGSMTTKRWTELGQQLETMGLLARPARADACWFDVNSRER